MTLLAQIEAVLEAVDFPVESIKPVWRERTLKVILAFAGLTPRQTLADAAGWGEKDHRLIRSRELIELLNAHWGEVISRGGYDIVRRESVKFLQAAGIVLKNPDQPSRAPNSPATGYALSPEFAELLRSFGTESWDFELRRFIQQAGSLRAAFRKHRDMEMVPVMLPDGVEVQLSPGRHNILQAKIIEEFLPRYMPGCELVYLGDAEDRALVRNDALAAEAGFFALDHQHLPDIIVFDRRRSWLTIIEAVDASGHLTALRMRELKALLVDARYPQVFVSAFLTYKVFSRFAAELAWETEAWIAEHPTHLIHFDGKRYLGPYE